MAKSRKQRKPRSELFCPNASDNRKIRQLRAKSQQPGNKFPRTFLGTISKKLAREYLNIHKASAVREAGSNCLLKKDEENKYEIRPVVNIGGRTLRKRDLAPEYQYLAPNNVKEKITFAHLHSLVNDVKHEPGKTVSIKLARLALLLAPRSHLASVRSDKILDNLTFEAFIASSDASHLCSTPGCFEPSHIVPESRRNNISRNKCWNSGFRVECPHVVKCKTFIIDVPRPSRRRTFPSANPRKRRPEAPSPTLESTKEEEEREKKNVRLDGDRGEGGVTGGGGARGNNEVEEKEKKVKMESNWIFEGVYVPPRSNPKNREDEKKKRCKMT